MQEHTNQAGLPAIGTAKPKFDMNRWWNARSLGEKIVLGTAMAILAIAGMAVFTLVFMALWNAVVPAIFGAGQINYWQALGIIVLSWIIFGTGNSSRKSKG